MNEQLRKAIEEATRVKPWQVPLPIGGSAIDIYAHNASQAKLLRVIKLLVQQRDTAYVCPLDKDLGSMIAGDDAELIAALENGKAEG